MSYNTVEECDAYIRSHYLEMDDAFGNWDALTEEDKAVLLLKAYDLIEQLPFVGRKTSKGQPSAFPRWPATEVPYAVKAAECELALALSDSTLNADYMEYRRMIEYGIQSYQVGNFRETLLSYNKQNPAFQYGLVSTVAAQLLKPYMSGGYRIG